MTCCGLEGLRDDGGVERHVATCPSLRRPDGLDRKPRPGDRCVAVRVREGRLAEAQFGTVVEEHGSRLTVRIHATRAFSVGVSLDDLAPADEWREEERGRVVGEWEGHAQDGPLCWCVPSLQRVGALFFVAHRPAALRPIPATLRHDAGAHGRCSGCGRYSADPGVLKGDVRCECGRVGWWTGSFKPPDDDSRWAGRDPAE